MKWSSFQTIAPGKWVLAGEHAVLRGVAAVALPHPTLHLSLSFEPRASDGGLEFRPPEIASDLKQLLASAVALDGVAGCLNIESTIPFGAGLGSSAALCVAVTRWLAGPMSLPQAQWADFATRLENHFHGMSSGMDIAVILSGEPVSFVRGQGVNPLRVRKLPCFTFHDTGLRARTSECVARVEALGREHPERGRRLDCLMAEASNDAAEGLKLFDSGDTPAGLKRVGQAMRRSQECFEGWGLIPPAARELERHLIHQGARAVKLTGAGGGGMIVALWDEPRDSFT